MTIDYKTNLTTIDYKTNLTNLTLHVLNNMLLFCKARMKNTKIMQYDNYLKLTDLTNLILNMSLVIYLYMHYVYLAVSTSLGYSLLTV